MYKLVISDDEKIIRTGLKNMIDWNKLGFEVTDLFSDGQEVIESLDSIIPDVVLTDIKMVYATGLDIAKYVFENKIPSKVVLISGYQEFDLALTGMKYGVADYLLKPVDVDEVEKTFSRIKEDLDKEKNREERMEDAIPLLEEHFFSDLILGGITDREQFIKNRFDILYPGVQPETCSCFIADIKICDYKHFISDVWNYTQDQLEQNLVNFFKIYNEDCVFHIVYKSGDWFEIVGIYSNTSGSKENCIAVMDKLKNDLKQNFLFSCQYKLTNYYASVYDLGKKDPSEFQNWNEDWDYQNHRIEEQKKLMMSNIFGGNIGAAQKIFNSILSELDGMHISDRNNKVIDILATMNKSLKDTNEALFHSLQPYFNYSAILSMKTLKEIDDYCSRIFDRILMAKKKNELSDTENLITRAKSYIQEHIYQDISQEAIANQLFICPAYLSRLFKKETGENFSQYVTKVKMEKAIELLKDPHYKTYQIGETLGYKTPRYFSRLFRQQTGLNPSEYRKKVLNSEDIFDEQ